MKLLLYCTKNKKQLFYDTIRQKYMFGLNGKNDKFNALNGKIVAECDFVVEEIVKLDKCISYFCRKTTLLQEKSCLTNGQIYSYLKDKNGYAIHIKNLKIFDKPKELSETTTEKDLKLFYNSNYACCLNTISKAPQNMMKVKFFTLGKGEGVGMWEDYILISIRPQWLCKILNGEKTIEVRKKVLKEMIG